MLRIVPLVILAVSLSGCGLVKAPFRVAGALTHGAYAGGKKVVNASSDALERRKQRKEREQEEAAKAEAKQSQGGDPAVPGPVPPPVGTLPTEGPIIPLSEPIDLPPPQ